MENENDLDKYIDTVSDIPAENDETPDTTEEDSSTQDDDFRSEQPDQSNADEAAQVQDARPDTKGQKPQDKSKKNDKRGKGKEAATQDQLRPLGDGVYANSRGDIVDQSGKLIAQNGFAARMFQTNRRLKAQLEERVNQLNDLSRQVGEVQALSRSIQQYGLDNNEVAQALDLAGRMKRGDVLGVAKDVLAVIAAKGYNVTDLLGSEVGDSIELKAVRNMIDERLAPITRQEQQNQQRTEAEKRGKQAYDRFVAENEYADVHANDIVMFMKREGIGPQLAYNRLLQFASVNRLDFSKPLGPQIAQRVQLQKQRQTQQSNNRSQQKPMPNGAATRKSGAVPTQPLASADDDWGTIISEVQRTLGNA